MRVVIVSDFGEVNGGAAKVAITSARGLADVGIPVSFVCAIAPISERLLHPQIAVHCLDIDEIWSRANPMAAAMQGVWNPRARSALETILADVGDNETIVHFHQWTKAFSPSVLMAPLRRKLPSVVSLHDYFLVCPNGAYYDYSRNAVCRVTPLSPACIAKKCDRVSPLHKAVRVARQYATKRAIARVGSSLSVVSVSHFAERVVDEFLPNTHSRFVVDSPIAAVKTAPACVAKNKSFVYVGRLTREKGVHLLADVAREADLPLTIAGGGPLLNELRRLGGTIQCTGWLDDAAVIETIRGARALVFPSTWYETGGLVVLEALAQGVPVIVSRTTAAADHVVDDVNGYVVDPNDRALLKERMLALSDDETAARMGEDAYRRYWSEPRTLEAHTGNLLSVYRHVLDANRMRAA